MQLAECRGGRYESCRINDGRYEPVEYSGGRYATCRT